MKTMTNGQINGIMSLTSSVIDWLKRYTRNGWRCIPLRRNEKAPIGSDWVTREYPESDFTNRNIGILLGAPSGWLVNIDLDDSLAAALAGYYLPRTNMLSGHGAIPTHYWFVAPNAKTRKFVARNGVIVEIRSTGAQSVVPPSVHPNGEQYEWHEFGKPAQVSAVELEHACGKLAAASLIARFWVNGQRHELALAVAGLLAKSNWKLSDIVEFMEPIIEVREDEFHEKQDRYRAIEDTYRRANRGLEVAGYRRLCSIIGESEASKVVEFLAIRQNGSESNLVESRQKENLSFIGYAVPCTQLEEYDLETIIPHLAYRDRINGEGTVAVLSGEPSVGKTTMVAELVYNLVNGNSIWGYPLPRRYKVLWLDYDHSFRHIREIIKKHYGVESLDEILVGRAPNTGMLPPLSQENLQAYMEFVRHHEIDFIVVDTLSGWFSGTEINSNTEISAWMALVNRIARECGVCILILHHTNKTRQEGTRAHLGSTRIVGSADIAVRLEHANSFGGSRVDSSDNTAALVIDKNRFETDDVRRVLFRKENRRFIPMTKILKREIVDLGKPEEAPATPCPIKEADPKRTGGRPSTEIEEKPPMEPEEQQEPEPEQPNTEPEPEPELVDASALGDDVVEAEIISEGGAYTHNEDSDNEDSEWLVGERLVSEIKEVLCGWEIDANGRPVVPTVVNHITRDKKRAEQKPDKVKEPTLSLYEQVSEGPGSGTNQDRQPYSEAGGNSMKIKITRGDEHGEGQYTASFEATLESVDEYEGPTKKRLGFLFSYKRRDGSSGKARGFVPYNTHPKSMMTRWFANILGTDPSYIAETEIDTDEMIGRKCIIEVVRNEWNGRTYWNVKQVHPAYQDGGDESDIFA